MTEMPQDQLDPVHVDADGGVHIGGQKLPGIIAERGVTVSPGGVRDVNEMTVKFLVGKVTIDDPIAEW